LVKTDCKYREKAKAEAKAKEKHEKVKGAEEAEKLNSPEVAKL